MMSFFRWPLRLAFVCLIALFTFAAPLSAQDTAAEETAVAPADVQVLVDILKDDAKRNALISQLERAEAAAPPVEEEVTVARSLGARVAEISRKAIADAQEAFTELLKQIEAAPAVFTNLDAEQISFFYDALRALALVIVASTATYVFLRFWLKRFFRRIGHSVEETSIGHKFLVVALMVAIDAGGVLISAGAGYIAALVFDPYGTGVGFRQALYLNAFIVVGLIKVAIRAVLSPTSGNLRLILVPGAGAKMMARWFGVIVSVLAYGQLLITPIAIRQLNAKAGASVSTLLAAIAILIAVWLTLRGRRPVANWLARGKRKGLLSILCRLWHIPVLIYLIGLFLLVASRPEGVLIPVLITSAQVLLAIVAGIIISGTISRGIKRGVSLHPAVTARLPMLEQRLNTFVPRLLGVIRLVIVICVAGFAVNAAGLVDVKGWLQSEAGDGMVSMAVSVGVIALFSFLLWIGFASWVDFRLNPEYGKVPSAREQTLLTLLKNAVTILFVVMTAMFILSEVGVNIAPLIASAGVFGLAIGFGAQKLVQDIITGVFIQFENAMNVGDVVQVNGVTGVVERLTIRSVSLRDIEGCFHIIPFSSVDMVSNYMREYGNFVCDMGIAYREDINEAKQAMHDAFDELIKIRCRARR